MAGHDGPRIGARVPAVRGAAVAAVAVLVLPLFALTAAAGTRTNEPNPVLVRTIGTQGSTAADPGDLRTPSGIAAAPGGDVYVADSDNHRVVRFEADGTFVAAWGTPGSGAGQFSNPVGIAVAPSGDVYVVDEGNDRVQRFSEDGTFVSTWGHNSTADGDFQSPMAIDVAPSGDVYVTSSTRVQRFTAAGTFISRWGSVGSGDGEFWSPDGIAIAPSGDVYVSDTDNGTVNRVQRFTADGTFVSTWGTAGSGNGQFSRPRGLAVSSTGDVYVADVMNHRIQRFMADGTFVSTWGVSGTGDGEFTRPRDVAIGAGGGVYVADTESNRVQRFTDAGGFVATWGQLGDGLPRFEAPRGVAVDSDGGLTVADTGNDRVQRFDSAIGVPVMWGTTGTGDGEFDAPEGVAVAPGSDADVYVADTGNDRIQRFEADGTFIAAWGTPGTSNGQFDEPAGVAVAPDGDVYVADRGNDRIQRFSATGVFEAAWGTTGGEDGQLDGPSGVAVGGQGVFVADVGNDRVQRFTSSGTFVHAWTMSTLNGRHHPSGVAVAAGTGVWVTSSRSNNSSVRVEHFSADGVSVANRTLSGFGSGGGVVARTDGRVFVAGPLVHGVGELAAGTGALVHVSFDATQELALVGQRVDYEVTVRNTGSEPLTGVEASYEGTPECDGPLPDLAVGEIETALCSHLAVAADVGDFENRVAVTSDQIDSLPEVGATDVSVTYADPFQLGQFASPGSGDGQLDQAGGIDVAPDGDVHVSNRRVADYYEVDVFEPDGTFQRRFDTGVFGTLADVAVGSDGDVYVADSNHRRVRRYQFDGTVVGQSALLESLPRGVTIRPDGHAILATASYDECTIDPPQCQTLGRNGWSEYAATGALVGDFASLDGADVGVAPDGRVYRPETAADRVVVHSATGEALPNIGTGDAPTGVDVDAFGNVYVAVSGTDEVRVYSPARELLAKWAVAADELAVSDDGSLIYVLDKAASKVRVFGFGLSGVVTEDGTGDPLGGVWAVAIDSGGAVAAGAVADDAGRYRLRVGPGAYKVAFIDPSAAHVGEWSGGVPLDQFGAASPVGVGMTGATLGVGLAPARGSVSGTVTEEGTGTPLAGVWVAAARADNGALLGTISDGGGHYEIGGLDPGPHVLAFLDPTRAHAFEFHDDKGAPALADPVSVTAGGTVAVDADLVTASAPPAGATIEGTVTDDESGDPVAGAWVLVVATDGSFRGGSLTDGSGHHSRPVGPGSYRVEVVDPSGDHRGEWHEDTPLGDYAGGDVVTVGPGGTETVDVGLEPTRGSIEGIVTDSSGATAGAYVAAISTATGRPAGAATVAWDGSYTIHDLAPGAYLVAFIDPWGAQLLQYFAGASGPDDADPVAVLAGHATTADAALGGPPPLAFDSPWGVAVDDEGDPLVADTANNRIARRPILPSGGSFGSLGTGLGQFDHPAGVAWARRPGNLGVDIFVADTGNDRIQQFNGSAVHQRTFGTSGEGQLDGPTGVDVSTNSGGCCVFVADTGNNRVVRFTRDDGVFVRAFGTLGPGPGQLDSPADIAAGGGHVYVADGGANDRISVFAWTGTNDFELSWGSHGTGPGEFSEPSGIALAPDGDSVYVTDDAPPGSPDRVQRFTLTGTLLDSWGSEGSGPGQFDAIGGIAVAGNGDVWVTDAGINNRITRFTADGTYLSQHEFP